MRSSIQELWNGLHVCRINIICFSLSIDCFIYFLIEFSISESFHIKQTVVWKIIKVRRRKVKDFKIVLINLRLFFFCTSKWFCSLVQQYVVRSLNHSHEMVEISLNSWNWIFRMSSKWLLCHLIHNINIQHSTWSWRKIKCRRF